MTMARHGSPFPSQSPPPPPLSKRDVRRNRIMEKLQGMIDSFSSNQHDHYRAQLQALQVDMTLVLNADPYAAGGANGNGLLEESGEEIRSLVEGMVGHVPDDEAARRDFAARAGSWYRGFTHDVNDTLEKRDADLTALHNHYTASVKDLERLMQQKIRQAEEEHKALSKTVRERLIATITKKRQQLLRDKEQLDIADSNALLLHPNHFGINNPGSPPNGVHNRKTRHTRHRAGSPNPGDLEGNGKKKRKAAAMEDDGNESPAPLGRPLAASDMLGSRSPLRDARENNVYKQYEAPAYSLERLFTEKELAMATDTAKIATWRYFHQPQEQQQEHESNGAATGAASIVDEAMETAEDEEVVVAALTTEEGDATPQPGELAAPEMERSTSHQVLTRGGARANPLAALNDLAAVATSERATAGVGLTTSKDPFAPVVPSYHAVTRSEKSGAPAPSGVSQLDVENDFALMRSTASRHARSSYDQDPEALPTAPDTADLEDEEAANQMRRSLLDQALGESQVSTPYRLPLLETGPALIGRGVERIPGTGFAPVLSFEQRVKQQAAPVAAGGAMAAALQGKLGGGEAMSRTTSAGGVSEPGEVAAPVARRGRGRQLV